MISSILSCSIIENKFARFIYVAGFLKTLSYLCMFSQTKINISNLYGFYVLDDVVVGRKMDLSIEWKNNQGNVWVMFDKGVGGNTNKLKPCQKYHKSHSRESREIQAAGATNASINRRNSSREKLFSTCETWIDSEFRWLSGNYCFFFLSFWPTKFFSLDKYLDKQNMKKFLLWKLDEKFLSI